jgi:hypothetical protein
MHDTFDDGTRSIVTLLVPSGPNWTDVEDIRDAEIARQRLAEIAANPDTMVQGDLLEKRLERWLS